MRPDGNCFYRAFSFALFEILRCDGDELNRIKEMMKNTKDFLINNLSYPSITVEDFYDQVLDFVDLLPKAKSSDDLREMMSDPGLANYVVCWMRLVASAELQKQPDFYIHFLPDVCQISDFCRREVEPLGVDIDHVVITALSTGMNVGVRVVCLERTPGKPQIIDFCSDSPKINLLFRPGHYDILYKTI